MKKVITEWNLEEAQRAWLAQGIEMGVGKGRDEIVALLKSGKSPDDIIKEFDDKTATVMPTASTFQTGPQA